MAATIEHEKIELSEQTPLKSDIDAPATNDQPSTEGTAAEAAHGEADKSKKAFKLFHFGKGHKHSKSGEMHEGNEAKPNVESAGTDEKEKPKDNGEKEKINEKNAEEPKPKEKKPSWWNKKCQNICHNHPAHTNDTQGTAQQLTYGVNLIQRDDNNLHTAVDFGFDDIYGEPDSTHSIAGVWKANHCVFIGVRNFFYKLISAIIVLPLAIIFGILFAITSVLSVFVCVPTGRLLSIPANLIFKAWSYVISSVFDPIFHAIGQTLANVRISRYGINNDPTAVLTA